MESIFLMDIINRDRNIFYRACEVVCFLILTVG